MSSATFLPTVAEATAAGYFPGRHTVEVTEVTELTPGVVRFTFRDPYIAAHAKPAQFVNLFSHDPMKLLPRPFGVSEVSGDLVSLIFAVVGAGTAEFAVMRAGDAIDVLGPLGGSFKVKEPAHYVLVGGGLGVPPLIYAAQRLAERSDCAVTAVFGYRDAHFADEFVSRYVDTRSIDETEGNVVTLLDRMEAELTAPREDGLKTVFLTCGPTPMMKAVALWASRRGIECQASMEQRMGCGYGTCVVCVVDTVDGRRKVCSDGPVFTAQQLGWEA